MERHVTRWAAHGVDTDALAKLSIGILAAFEGTIGIYQGEELGLEQTEMEYHELTDPPGLRFWPEVKGRDGCRTPMVWDAQAPHGGFSDATPWLPVKAPQWARAVSGQGEGSVLEHYRQVLAYRRGSDVLRRGRTEFVDVGEPILAFHRVLGDRAVTCVFNLSAKARAVEVAGDVTVGVSLGDDHSEGRVTLQGNGFVYLEGHADNLPVISAV